MDSDPESRPEPPRILKRLRRGPTATPTTKTPSSHAVDDDIEDFSSEDDFLKEMITAFDEDLWKDFCPTKSFGIPTPAFDEVFEEYFQSLKDKNVPQRPSHAGTSNNGGHHGNTTNSQNDEQIWDSDDPLPPAHHYFFHHDPRIQNLVRNRLPSFSPLGVINNRKYQQPNASAIDYMRQFNNEEASKRQATQKLNVEKSSTRGRNKLKKIKY
ncbi:hypothetical protein CMV_020794 [Castanea mollissima]|uniref:Uncharacterized protein n=1 Tax=Castanea mollissima TaxID=60419 RepID=A0A8J4V9W5_9ROSI|nr:hypothetical protein CMV_020794 [Castanea mollissima]